MNKLLAKRKDIGKTKSDKPVPNNRRVLYEEDKDKNKDKKDKKRQAENPPPKGEPPAKRPAKEKKGRAPQESKSPWVGFDSKVKPAGSEVSRSETDKVKSKTKRSHKNKKAEKPNQRRVTAKGVKDEAAIEVADSDSKSE